MRSSEVADEHILNKWHVNKMGGNKQVHYSVSVSVEKTCACTERFKGTCTLPCFMQVQMNESENYYRSQLHWWSTFTFL